MSNIKSLSIDIVMDNIAEKEKAKPTKEDILEKVKTLYELSEMSDKNQDHFQYMLRIYRRLKEKKITCPCLHDTRAYAAGYLFNRISTASGENFEEIDPKHLKTVSGAVLT